MSYKVETITNFRKEAKKLIQKYPSLTTEIENIGIQLADNPTLGVSIGKNCFKIRLSIAPSSLSLPAFSARDSTTSGL
jgi:hypothetical protein